MGDGIEGKKKEEGFISVALITKIIVCFLVKSELINITRARGEEKNLSPRQELNPWPPEHPAGALSTELRELVESKF